jgi:hypothetical protein
MLGLKGLKFDTTTILVIALIAVVILFGWSYLTNPLSEFEGMDNMEMEDNKQDSQLARVGGPKGASEEEDQEMTTGNTGDISEGMEDYSSPTQSVQQASCYPSETLKPSELLPQGANDFSEMYPSGQGGLGDKNFLQAGFASGIDTVGQTLRNPNLQLRSEPLCSQVVVSPWMQTTINPDVLRRKFELSE